MTAPVPSDIDGPAGEAGDLIAWLNKASKAIYLATDGPVADEISPNLLEAAARLAALDERVHRVQQERDEMEAKAERQWAGWIKEEGVRKAAEALASSLQRRVDALEAGKDFGKVEVAYVEHTEQTIAALQRRVEELTGKSARVFANPCIQKLGPDEPFFVLLGRDKHAAEATRAWADFREAERGVSPKTTEAREIAAAMEAFATPLEQGGKP